MPEEVNRVVTDHLSSVLLAPSEAAVANLLAEGISNGVHSVGDIMADSVRIFSKRAQEQSTILDRLMLSPNDYVLGTLHRASNTDSIENLVSIFKGLSSSDHKVVIPLHPRTRKVVDSNQISVGDNVRFVDPVGYLDMLQLVMNSTGVITDSGGLQKEAYYMGVRCLTMRENTEWVETLDNGWNELVGTDATKITSGLDRFSHVLNADRPVLYGDGYSAEKMVKVIEDLKG
jgi:UDP-GlcNAc3NAcA epimerase